MSTRSSSRIGYHHCLGECGAINTSTHGFFRCFQYLRYQYRWGNIFKHSFPCHTEWIYCPRYRKLIRKGELKKHLQQLVFSLYSESIRLYSEWRTSRKTCSLTPVLLGSIRLSDIPVDLFDSRLPTNSFYLVCEQLGSLFLDLLQWNISQTRQHSWKDIAPPPSFPIEKIWHHCWVVSTEFMLFSSMLSKWIWANWTTLISN